MPSWMNSYESPLGRILLAGNGAALTGLWFEEQRFYADGLPAGSVCAETPILDLTRKWLDLYFSGIQPDFTPPTALSGTVFRLKVWRLLSEIPYGETVSYGDLAARLSAKIGRPSSPRAVGGAVGRNPISLIIPCHRVIGADGSLTGYAGGLDRKRALLALERGEYPFG